MKGRNKSHDNTSDVGVVLAVLANRYFKKKECRVRLRLSHNGYIFGKSQNTIKTMKNFLSDIKRIEIKELFF
jgi:predicted RNA-binding protein YlqC (UPF0109 family)